jgi:hypothetical protein
MSEQKEICANCGNIESEHWESIYCLPTEGSSRFEPIQSKPAEKITLEMAEKLAIIVHPNVYGSDYNSALPRNELIKSWRSVGLIGQSALEQARELFESKTRSEVYSHADEEARK